MGDRVVFELDSRRMSCMEFGCGVIGKVFRRRIKLVGWWWVGLVLASFWEWEFGRLGLSFVIRELLFYFIEAFFWFFLKYLNICCAVFRLCCLFIVLFSGFGFFGEGG